jgi:hypothetical protein
LNVGGRYPFVVGIAVYVVLDCRDLCQ